MSSDLGTRVVEAINNRDLDAIETLTAPDVQLRLPPGQVFFGHQGIRAFANELAEVLPQLTVIARRRWEGPGFAVIEFDSAGRSAQDNPSETMGAIVMELDAEERLTRVQVYLDTAQWDSLHWQALTKPEAGGGEPA